MKFKLLRTVFKTDLLGIPVLLLLAILLAAWAVRRAWPQEEGKIVVQGLSAPVEVVRDRWGIPHLYAANEHDLFFAQGFVHAQDRLWPMFFNRVVGSGRLSELFGPGTLPTDRSLRAPGRAPPVAPGAAAGRRPGLRAVRSGSVADRPLPARPRPAPPGRARPRKTDAGDPRPPCSPQHRGRRPRAPLGRAPGP